MIDFPDDEYTTRACQEIAAADSLDWLDRLVSINTLSLLGAPSLTSGLPRVRRIASTARARQVELYDLGRLKRTARVEYEAARGGGAR